MVYAIRRLYDIPRLPGGGTISNRLAPQPGPCDWFFKIKVSQAKPRHLKVSKGKNFSGMA
jgi:hypothetical protein